MLELTHNFLGTKELFQRTNCSYNNGNKEPQGFRHIGFSVPGFTYKASESFESQGVNFIKKPDDGKMVPPGLAFLTLP